MAEEREILAALESPEHRPVCTTPASRAAASRTSRSSTSRDARSTTTSRSGSCRLIGAAAPVPPGGARRRARARTADRPSRSEALQHPGHRRGRREAARLRHREAARRRRVGDTTITEARGRLLTPDYASPEQIAGAALGHCHRRVFERRACCTSCSPASGRTRSPPSSRRAGAACATRRPSDAASDPSMRRALARRSRRDRAQGARAAARRAIRHDQCARRRHRPLSAAISPCSRGRTASWYRVSKCVARNIASRSARPRRSSSPSWPEPASPPGRRTSR